MDTQTLAVTALNEGEFTCVVAYKGKVVFTSAARGVKPLVDYYHNHGNAYEGAALADRVIGRAAALLVQLSGIRSVYGEVMSAPARDELEAAGITPRYKELAEAIRNRDNTGLCPMEHLSKGVTDPQEMLAKVEDFLQNIGKK